MTDSKRLTVVTLLGVIAFISKGFLPNPVDKMFVLVQALTFALASLLTRGWGATYTSVVNGVLLSVLRIGFFPFSIIFSVIYGLLIDSLFRVFEIKTGEDNPVKTRLVICLLTLSSAITGLVSMYLSVLIGIMPMNLTLYLIVLVAGTLNGVVVGYLTALIWNKYLTHHVESLKGQQDLVSSNFLNNAFSSSIIFGFLQRIN